VPCRSIGSSLFLCALPHPVPVWDLVAEYERHEPEKALLHQVVREQLEGFLASAVRREQPTLLFEELLVGLLKITQSEYGITLASVCSPRPGEHAAHGPK